MVLKSHFLILLAYFHTLLGLALFYVIYTLHVYKFTLYMYINFYFLTTLIHNINYTNATFDYKF